MRTQIEKRAVTSTHSPPKRFMHSEPVQHVALFFGLSQTLFVPSL